MSLSKYYTNSKSFQPEELLKREEKRASGWQPSQTTEQIPFQPQQRPAASEPKEIPQALTPDPKPPVAESTSPSKQLAETTQQKVVEEKPPPPLPAQQAIDLSNYLELSVANTKIDEAYEKGVQAGLQTAKETAEQDFIDATKALFIACQQLDTVRETIISNSREELQEFALSIAERILRFSVREQDQTIIATIEEALQRAVRSDEFVAYINPEDYDTVTENAAEIIAGLSGLNKIVIKKDATIERGGAKIESDNCTIDATITSQLDIIREEVRKNL